MSVIEIIGFSYIVLAVGCFTAAWVIACSYVISAGIKTIWRWIQAGQKAEIREVN